MTGDDPSRDASPEAARARLYETRAGLVDAAVVGSGPAIVLVHGTLGSSRQVSGLAADLSSERPWCWSPAPDMGIRHLGQVEQQADACAALLDRLAISRSAVLGVSSGAPSAIAFALKFPARVLRQ